MLDSSARDRARVDFRFATGLSPRAGLFRRSRSRWQFYRETDSVRADFAPEAEFFVIVRRDCEPQILSRIDLSQRKLDTTLTSIAVLFYR